MSVLTVFATQPYLLAIVLLSRRIELKKVSVLRCAMSYTVSANAVQLMQKASDALTKSWWLPPSAYSCGSVYGLILPSSGLRIYDSGRFVRKAKASRDYFRVWNTISWAGWCGHHSNWSIARRWWRHYFSFLHDGRKSQQTFFEQFILYPLRGMNGAGGALCKESRSGLTPGICSDSQAHY